MSGFIATHPAAPPAGSAGDTIRNDGWWPDLALSEIRAGTRIDGTVTEPRLRDAVLYAIVDTNRQLAGWRDAQERAGRASLADVPAPQVGGASQLVVLYVRAIRCAVSADVMEHYRNFDAAGAGDARAEQADQAINEQRRNARWAVRDIQGQTHVTVELI